MTSTSYPLHLGYIDGGNWQAAMIGKRTQNVEVGMLIRLGGSDIDNDNMPVPYRIEWRNKHKFYGFIVYREQERKFCAANAKTNLPCQ